MNVTSLSPRLGGLDPSFGNEGVFDVAFDGYDAVEPAEIDTVRAFVRAPDGSFTLALAFGKPDSHTWQYGLVRLTPNGHLDPAFGTDGIVIGSLPAELLMGGAQPLIDPDGGTVVVVRNTESRQWTLARHDSRGARDEAFGGMGGYVNLDSIRPPGEPIVIKGFIIAGPERSFYFIGSVADDVAGRVIEGATAIEDGGTRELRYAGAVVCRFDGSGRLDTTFAGTGYVYVDVPLNPSGRITDAVMQDDGKLVLSTATTGGNSRIVRLLADTGTPDPDFGTNGVFVVEGDSADRMEIEKLAWSSEAGLWGVGRNMNLLPRVGLLLALDDKGRIREDFNGGRLMEINYGGAGTDDGFCIPVHIHASGAGVTVAGGPRRPYGTEPKVLIVGRHLASGALDRSFGEADAAGTPKGFYRVDLDRKGYNFYYLGLDLDDEYLTVELLNGDGAPPNPNADRTIVERYIVSQGSPASAVNVNDAIRR
jgi:uncharacterized delta-60 repeat protein